MDKPLFTNHDSLFVDDVVKLAILFFKDVIFIIFFIFVVFKVFITRASVIALSIFSVIQICVTVFTLEHIRLSFTLFLSMLVVQLHQNVLDLAFELVINLIHEILEDFGHAKFFCLLSKLLASED